MLDITKLQNYRVILVSGPQRSGTTIMSKMLAHDLNWDVYDEDDYGVENVDAWRELVETGNMLVIQCPAMLHLCDDLPEDVALIVMTRPIEDIHASEKRIGWESHEAAEAAKYGRSRNPAQAKYDWLYENEVDFIPHEYGSDYMREHPLWRDNRKHFSAKQTA